MQTPPTPIPIRDDEVLGWVQGAGIATSPGKPDTPADTKKRS